MLKNKDSITVKDFTYLQKILYKEFSIFFLNVVQAEVNEIQVKGYSKDLHISSVDSSVIGKEIHHLGLDCTKLTVVEDDETNDKVCLIIKLK